MGAGMGCFGFDPVMQIKAKTLWRLSHSIGFICRNAAGGIHRPILSWVSFDLNQIDGNPL
jgi:hypothetical protein